MSAKPWRARSRASGRAAAAALLLALPSCGLASADAFADRGRDLADCFTLTVSAGPELSADLKLTEALHLAVGGGVHGEAGLAGGRWGYAGVATLGLPVAPFLEDGVLHGRYLFTEAGGGWDASVVEDECYAIHFLDLPPTHPERLWLDRFDVELGFTVLLGARLGVRPGQCLDFWAGFLGADPADDDGR